MGHWYDINGEPRHFEGKDGKGTTLREARKLDLYPSVTTVGQVVAKFALTNWLQEEAAMMAAKMFADSGGGYLIDRAFARDAVNAAREETMAKADAGTDIHDILEKHQGGMEYASKHKPMCEAVESLILEKTGLSLCNDFYAESRFCNHDDGYAGMCDLHSIHMNGTYAGREPDRDEWIIDYKSKDTVDAKTRGWPEQAEQLAAYAHGLGRPNARLANIFISRSYPSQVVWFEHKDPLAWERFRHTLMLWQVSKKFGPYYDKLMAA